MVDVPDDVAEDFPQFDLTVLTQKQLDVLVMRYRGDLSWRKIAAFEGVFHYAIQCRHRYALLKLESQTLYISRISRGHMRPEDRSTDRPSLDSEDRHKWATDVRAEGGGSDIERLCW